MYEQLDIFKYLNNDSDLYIAVKEEEETQHHLSLKILKRFESFKKDVKNAPVLSGVLGDDVGDVAKVKKRNLKYFSDAGGVDYQPTNQCFYIVDTTGYEKRNYRSLSESWSNGTTPSYIKLPESDQLLGKEFDFKSEDSLLKYQKAVINHVIDTVEGYVSEIVMYLDNKIPYYPEDAMYWLGRFGIIEEREVYDQLKLFSAEAVKKLEADVDNINRAAKRFIHKALTGKSINRKNGSVVNFNLTKKQVRFNYLTGDIEIGEVDYRDFHIDGYSPYEPLGKKLYLPRNRKPGKRIDEFVSKYFVGEEVENIKSIPSYKMEEAIQFVVQVLRPVVDSLIVDEIEVLDYVNGNRRVNQKRKDV